MNQPHLISPIDTEVSTRVSSGQNTVQVNINCHLYPTDHERLLDLVSSFLPTCVDSIKWAKNWNDGKIL